MSNNSCIFASSNKKKQEMENNDKDMMEEFIKKSYNEEFEAYKKEKVFHEIAENFVLFNEYFKKNEVRTLLESANSYESLYRNRNSCSCLSHGKLSYFPCFRGTGVDGNKMYSRETYLSLYMYVIAVHNGMDFYFNHSCDDAPMEIESTRFSPFLYDTIEGRYEIDESGVHIKKNKK